MIRLPEKHRSLAIALLTAALALLIAGSVRSYKIYDKDNEDFGILTFSRVTDRLLVIDATFRGVERTGKRLYTTYDRSQKQGKRPCPT